MNSENYPKIKNIAIDDNNKIEVFLNQIIPTDIEYLKFYVGESECIPEDVKNKTSLDCNFNNLYHGKYVPVIRSNYGNLLYEDNPIELNVDLKIISISYTEKDVN